MWTTSVGSGSPLFSNFGSLKSTETSRALTVLMSITVFSNFGSLKSTETAARALLRRALADFSNFGSLKSTETHVGDRELHERDRFQQFRLVEEH